MDTTATATTPAEATPPLTKLQALRERWAAVRAKLAAALRGLDPWPVAAGVALAVVIALAIWFRPGAAPAPVVSTASAPAIATAPATDHAAAIAELQASVNYLIALAKAQPPSASAPPARQTAPQPRASARAMPAPQPMPQAAPAGATAWGTTDLDRAIAEFDPATATPKPTTNTATGAQP